MPIPIKITIIAFDETANGLLKYTTSPIRAKVYFIPKASIGTKHIPTGHGAYILLGQKDGQKAVYVGMSKHLQKRLKQHAAAAPDSISWDKAIAIAAADKHFLAGTGAEYLEADLYHKAEAAGTWQLANITPVPYPRCPTVDRVAYASFLAEVYLFIALAGYDIFKTAVGKPITPSHITFKNYRNGVLVIPS